LYFTPFISRRILTHNYNYTKKKFGLPAFSIFTIFFYSQKKKENCQKLFSRKENLSHPSVAIDQLSAIVCLSTHFPPNPFAFGNGYKNVPSSLYNNSDVYRF